MQWCYSGWNDDMHGTDLALKVRQRQIIRSRQGTVRCLLREVHNSSPTHFCHCWMGTVMKLEDSINSVEMCSQALRVTLRA